MTVVRHTPYRNTVQNSQLRRKVTTLLTMHTHATILLVHMPCGQHLSLYTFIHTCTLLHATILPVHMPCGQHLSLYTFIHTCTLLRATILPVHMPCGQHLSLYTFIHTCTLLGATVWLVHMPCGQHLSLYNPYTHALSCMQARPASQTCAARPVQARNAGQTQTRASIMPAMLINSHICTCAHARFMGEQLGLQKEKRAYTRKSTPPTCTGVRTCTHVHTHAHCMHVLFACTHTHTHTYTHTHTHR